MILFYRLCLSTTHNHPSSHHPSSSHSLLTTPNHSQSLPITPHHSSSRLQPPHHPSSQPLFKVTESDQRVCKHSLSNVYKPLQDLPVTQNIISDHFLTKIILGQNRPKIGIWRRRARAKLRTCNVVDLFFHMQYFTPKYLSQRPLFHIFKSFLC